MTDILNKTQQSRTGSDTPETDAVCKEYCESYGGIIPIAFARKLERERDEARSDLAFRRDLYRLQEDRADKLVAEVELWKENATSNRDVFDEMVRERDQAVSACQIWQSGHSALVRDRDEALLERDEARLNLAFRLEQNAVQ